LKSLYVETRIRASLQSLWQHTQDPSLNEGWDLRFSQIQYLCLAPIPLSRSDSSIPLGLDSDARSAAKVRASELATVPEASELPRYDSGPRIPLR